MMHSLQNFCLHANVNCRRVVCFGIAAALHTHFTSDIREISFAQRVQSHTFVCMLNTHGLSQTALRVGCGTALRVMV